MGTTMIKETGLPEGMSVSRTMLSFGFVTSASAGEVAFLEALDIDSLWVGGHIAYRKPTQEVMMQLSRLSALTQRVRIGTSILLLPLYPPAIVAKQVADMDVYCGGRLTLGIGVGGDYAPEFSACGVPIQERGKRTDEAIPLLRRLWSGEDITHEGPFFPMENVRILPKPVQAGGPRIVIAGRKEPAMRRAARLGDGWMPYLYSPRAYAESVGKIREFASQANRDLSNFEWLAFPYVNIQDDTEQARQDAANFFGGGAQARDSLPMVDSIMAAGTQEQVTAKLLEFVKAGARHFVFVPATNGDRIAMTKRIVREVIPALREAVSGSVLQAP